MAFKAHFYMWLFLSAILWHTPQVRGQKKGQVVNRERTLSVDSYRNATFRYAQLLYSPLSYAHLYTTVNFSNSINQFNHLTHIYDAHLTKLHSIVDDPYFNSTLALLRAKLENGHDYVRFAAFIIGSDDEITMSKMSLPVKNPPSSDEIFFRNPNMWVWESIYGSSREKRQALIMSAIGLFGGVGFGLYNSAEISFLKQKLGDEDNKVGLLAHKLSEIDTTMSTHESRLYTMSTKINDMLKSSDKLEVRSEVNRVVSHYSLALDNVINHVRSISDMLIQGKLQPRFFHQSSVTKAFKSISEKASDHHLLMANTELSEILSEAASFHVDKGQIFFVLHLPLHSKTEFKLYEFINTPFPLVNGSAVAISTPHKWLAINQALSEHMILSDEDHKKCLTRRKGLICPTPVTQRSLKSTCLGSLYLGNMEHIAIHCSILPVDAFSEIVTKLDGNQVAIFSPPHVHTVAYISCPGFNESQQIIVREHETLQIEDSCLLVTPHYIFRSDQQLAITNSFLNRRLISVDNFQFRHIQPSPTLTPFLRHDYRSPENASSPAPSHHTWLLATIIAMLTLGLLLLLGLLPWRIRSRRGDKPERDECSTSLVDGERLPLPPPRHHPAADQASRWWRPRWPVCWPCRRQPAPTGKLEDQSIILSPPSPSSSARQDSGDRRSDGHGDGGIQKQVLKRKLELMIEDE